MSRHQAAREPVTVHVWGPPEDGMVGFDERVCDEPDNGEEVVFHVEPELFAGGARMCPVCATIFPPGGCSAKPV